MHEYLLSSAEDVGYTLRGFLMYADVNEGISHMSGLNRLWRQPDDYTN
ncbi:hypothetical protein NYE80_34590 [Paenibacillus sp. FSL H7-0357]